MLVIIPRRLCFVWMHWPHQTVDEFTSLFHEFGSEDVTLRGLQIKAKLSISNDVISLTLGLTVTKEISNNLRRAAKLSCRVTTPGNLYSSVSAQLKCFSTAN